MKIKASLAPMAGYTDSVFRQIAQNLGAAYTVSEKALGAGRLDEEKFNDGTKRWDKAVALVLKDIYNTALMKNKDVEVRV